MQRWKHGFAIALTAVIAAEASATGISDRKGDPVPPAATDLAVGDVWDARGVPVPDGGVGIETKVVGVDSTVVPEPDTLLLVSLGMFGLVVAGRRRQRQSQSEQAAA